MKIVLNPGHGGKYRSNVGPTGYVEADGVLDIGLRLKALLQAHSTATVYMTRETDKTLELYERAALANKWNGDLYISLHTNAGVKTAQGAEIYHTKRNEWGTKDAAEAKRVAAIVQKHVVAKTGMVDRGIKTRTVTSKGSPIYGMDYYADIRLVNMPALLMETGFHSNPEEEAKLKTGSFRQLIAEGILEGLLEAYPAIKKPTEQPKGTLYRVQTGAFKHRENADKLADKLKKEGYDTYIVVADGLYKVQTGAFAEQKNATALAKKLKAAGYDVYITTKAGQPAAPAKPAPKPVIKVGSKVKVKQGAKTYTGENLASFVYNTVYDVIQISGNRVVIGKGTAVTAAVHKKDLILQ